MIKEETKGERKKVRGETLAPRVDKVIDFTNSQLTVSHRPFGDDYLLNISAYPDPAGGPSFAWGEYYLKEFQRAVDSVTRAGDRYTVVYHDEGSTYSLVLTKEQFDQIKAVLDTAPSVSGGEKSSQRRGGSISERIIAFFTSGKK